MANKLPYPNSATTKYKTQLIRNKVVPVRLYACPQSIFREIVNTVLDYMLNAMTLKRFTSYVALKLELLNWLELKQQIIECFLLRSHMSSFNAHTHSSTQHPNSVNNNNIHCPKIDGLQVFVDSSLRLPQQIQ